MKNYEIPAAWFCAGSHPAEYAMGIDPEVRFQSLRAACLKCTTDAPSGFGTLMQNCSAEAYLGKRIRFTVNMRAEKITGWAGAWMRIDPASQNSRSLGFDNMQDRALTGTTDWESHSIVLDVPEGSEGVAYGVLLDGSGSVWLADLKIEVVDTDVPTTGRGSYTLERPENLNFSE